MVATTTAFSDLVNQLQNNFVDLKFALGSDFSWSADQKTVYYPRSTMQHAPQLLHEAAHGILGHSTYSRDLDLLKLEREAWSKAIELSKQYNIVISEDTVEDALDTYRDWLHARSSCPNCGKTGVQASAKLYKCVICPQSWRANDARTCGLKRTKL
ncbi:hypothetical protein EOL73_02480 [Candidatus Saccharibacteria bacterium]|nr:hypothetical protein [Candidatus Saccharibacteria bacterium]NCU40599.1 hypothetical protein [Candidatus Saccharibacteria bacterium]